LSMTNAASEDTRIDLASKFRGALLGTVIGDALGSGFEGWHHVTPAEIAKRFDDPPDQLSWSDDTAMTIGVAESLLACGGFDGDDMFETFSRNYYKEWWRGYATGPPLLFQQVREGAWWEEAARDLYKGTGSYGNGSAMRVAPAGLFGFPDLDRVAEVAANTSLTTHTHPLGVEGAVVQAVAVALVLAAEPDAPIDATEFLGDLRSRTSSKMFRGKLKAVAELLPDGASAAAADRLGVGLPSFEAVPAAIFAFLRNQGSFNEAIRYAVSLGGDTDTIAAMAGALAGAHLGEEAIPEPWRERVEKHDVLIQLADRLLHESESGEEQAAPVGGSS
jgi:poly(ADP-ribose) glycohydrolase ARH3